MKLIGKRMATFLALTSLGAVCHAATLPPVEGHGKAGNFIEIGIVMTNTTLNDCIFITDYSSTIPAVDASAMSSSALYVFNRSTGNWDTSSWDDLDESWLPNRQISAGDALRIYYNTTLEEDCNSHGPGEPAEHDSCIKIWQVGTLATGTKSITIRPGWNLLSAAESDNGTYGEYALNLGLSFADDERIGVTGAQDVNDCDPLSDFMYTWDTTNGWWVERDSVWLMSDIWVEFASAFWYVSSASTNFTWTQTFEVPNY